MSELDVSSVEPVGKAIFNAYPNSFDAQLKVSLQNDQGSLTSITLYDIRGRIVSSAQTGKTEFLLPASHLEQGVYLLSVSNAAGTGTMKVVKR